MTSATIESSVLGAITRFKFISAEEMSGRLDFTVSQIEKAISTLLSKRKIIQSVPGVPKRYSVFVPKKMRINTLDEDADTAFDYVIEKAPQDIEVK